MLRCAVYKNIVTVKPVTKSKAKANLKNAYPSDQKERGEWVELLFMANAARMGLKVAKPHGDSARYDVIVQGGGKLYRVQVKSTTFERKGCYECLCFWSRVSKTRQAKQYSDEQIDVVAAYVVPEDSWFIIPISELQTKTLYLPPRQRAKASKYGRFMEAWDLLGAGEGLTIHAAAENELVLELIKWKVAQVCGMQLPSNAEFRNAE